LKMENGKLKMKKENDRSLGAMPIFSIFNFQFLHSLGA